MKKILISNKEYTLEYGFEAAEVKSVVQRMFNALSMSYIAKRVDMDGENSKETIAAAMIDGTAELISELPYICKDAFYAGLLSHHKLDEETAYELLKTYMKENKISFKKVYEEIKEAMEDDGFFDLTGLTEMMKEMEGTEEEKPKRTPKQPQDHKKSTSTK